MNDYNLKRFYCFVCDCESVGQEMNIQTSKGIRQSIMCLKCQNITSLELLDAIVKKIREQNIVENISINAHLYEPTKIGKDGKEYDMQPRKR